MLVLDDSSYIATGQVLIRCRGRCSSRKHIRQAIRVQKRRIACAVMT